MPRIESGPAHGAAGQPHEQVTVTLSVDEAYELLLALARWSEDEEAGTADPDWHTHVSDDDGRELTVAIDPGP